MAMLGCSKTGTYSVDDGTSGPPHVFTPEDTTAPGLTIYTPTANQEFLNNSVISITGKLTDNNGLYRGTIKIVNDNNGLVLVNQAYEIHGLLEYNFSLVHTVSVTTASIYTVTVSFEDHGLNTTTKSVKVKVNP
jgi:hypothetical protein